MKKIVLSVLVTLFLVSVAFAAEAPEKTREPQFNDIPQIRLDAREKGTTMDLTLPRASFVTITTTVDYWYSEASWNVWSFDESAYYWDTDQVFTAGYETTVNTIFLPGGSYSVDCFDTYGDGGIAGQVVDIDGTLLVEWADYDYTSFGEFPFTVSGGVAPNPIEWGSMESSWYRSPFNVYYKNSIWETVYQQSYLGEACLIYGISFHTNFSSSSITPFDGQIWMGEVTQGDLSGGWLNAGSGELDLVFDGQMAWDGSEWWTFVLDTPYPYTNQGNLLVMGVRWDDDYFSYSDNWYTTDTGITDVSRHYYSDSIVPDPYTHSSDSDESPTSLAPDIRFYTQPMTGSLDGYVYNTATKGVIENAHITAGSYETWTDAAGYYLFADILAGNYDVVCEATGYNTGTANVDVTAGATTTQDFTLTSPTMDYSPTAIDVSVTPGGIAIEYINVANNGDGPLDWSAAIAFPDGIGRDWGGILDWGHKEKNTQTSTIDELAPDIWEDIQSAHRVAGDVLLTIDIETPTGDNQMLGAEWDGQNLWCTGAYSAGDNQIYKMDLSGNLLATYPQGTTSSWGMRDMTFDGTYLYAGDDDGFYQIDPADGSVTQLFVNNLPGLSCIRALAYIPGVGFVANNWSSDFVVFDAAGTVLDTWAGPGVSGYGLAYDEVTDCLWFFSSSGGRVLYQYDYYTQSMTGLSYDVNTAFPSGSVGGIFYDYSMISGTAVIGGVIQTSPDMFFAMELYPYDPWVTLDPNSGTLNPGENQDIEVYFDAAGKSPDNTYYADVNLASNPDVGTGVVNLSMEVYIPDGYVIEGFEGVGFPPFGWQNPGDYWGRYESDDALVGEGYARASWYHDADAILTTPRLEITGGDFINFWYRNANLYAPDGPRVEGEDTLFVEISNTYNNTVPVWEELLAISPPEEMDEWAQALAIIPDDYIGTDAKIRFRHRSNLSAEARGFGLDQILMPAPYLPVNFDVDPTYASGYNDSGEVVTYDFEITNTGVQPDRYYPIIDVDKSRGGRAVEDFESDDGGYTHDGINDTWEWGTPDFAEGPANAHSGTKCWGTNLTGYFLNSADFSLYSVEATLPDDASSLTFWHWYDFGPTPWDGGNIKISTDGGANWELIYPDGGYPCAELATSNPLYPEPGYAGEPGIWEQATFDLNAYNGQSVIIRWHCGTTSVVEWPGWYIDDVDISDGGPGPGPGPGPTAWPAYVDVPYLDLDPDETGIFTVTVEIPSTAGLDEGNVTVINVASREDPDVNEDVEVVTVCHPRDPYEPNDDLVDATPADYDFVSDGAQIYYNPDYKDLDLDVYTITGLEGDITWCAFELPEDEDLFDGAIKLVDEFGVELAIADEGGAGESEYLQYRLLEDGTYYWILGKWDEVYDGPTRKVHDRAVNTTFYVVTFDLIPSPEVDVQPAELAMGVVYGSGTIAEDELYISNVAPDALAENLNWDIELDIPGVATLFTENFDDPTGWVIEGGSNWGYSNSSSAGGTPPEAYFNWSPSTTATQRLISPIINTTGYTDVNLTFKHYVNDYNGDYTIGLATTSDGGTTWNDIWSLSPTGNIGPETFQIPIANGDVGSDQFQLCWWFDGNSFNINYWYVDDVYLGVGSSWLSVSPVAGSVGQGDTQIVTVTADATTRLDPGTYTADIIVHNDALLYGASDIIVPVTFYVSEEAGGLRGNVTFGGDPVPDVMVKVGNFVTYTDDTGFYEFDSIASGFYNVYFYKDGFQPHWEYGVYLNPGWVVLLDVELIFDGPVPEDLTATGVREAIELDWNKPSSGGGGTQVDYILDDGTYENGWCINPGYSSWLGNQFPVTDGGEIISFDVYGDINAAAGTEQVTIDVFDDSHNFIGTSDPFQIPAGDWVTVNAPNIPFSGEFYAMIHWDMLSAQTNWAGFDENGPNANAGYDWYYDGASWQLLHVAAGSDPGVFMLRTTAMVRGQTVEVAYNTYRQGKTPQVEFQPVDNSAFLKGEQVLDNVFAQSQKAGDTGNYEVSHYTFNGEKELGFRMPGDITLLGYNVYEEDKGFVAYVDGENNTEYTDDIVAVGEEFTYWVTAVYEEGESAPSNLASAVPLPPSGGWLEDFSTNWAGRWTEDPADGNWDWQSGSGGYARLYWSPSVAPYDMSLISPDIYVPDATIGDLTITMYLNNYSSSGGEVWEVWIVHGGGEDLIWDYDDPTADWGVDGGTDFVYSDMQQYAASTINIKFRSHGGDTFNFDWWNIYNVYIDWPGVPPNYGALEGTVTDSNGDPIEGVQVTADHADYNPVWTDEFGYYTIDPMEEGTYDVNYYKDGYTEIWEYGVVIVADETTVVDVTLGNPEMAVDPTSINATVPVGGTTTRTITVTNDGTAPLDWSAAITNMTDKSRFLVNTYQGEIKASMEAEADLIPSKRVAPPSRDMWDVLFGYDVDTPSGLTGISGAECGDDYFYVTKWAGSEICKFDFDGNWIENFTIPGVTQLRDLAYDGTYFYGSNASNYIWQMDFDSQTLISTLPTPAAVRAIAYDSDNDAFWFNNWSENLQLIDRSGNILETIPAPPSMYGCAYDNVTDGGPYLWIFTGTSTGGGCQIEQYDLNTLNLTGVTHSVSGDFPGTIAGGLFTTGAPVPGTWVIGGLGQASPDMLFGYELGPLAQWISIDPTSGTVDPNGGTQDVIVTFDACDDPLGTIHTCDINFTGNEVDPITVPVTMMVGTPDYGDLEGMVTTATGGNPVEGAEIVATMGTTVYTTYSTATGYYEILDMMVGYYTVECTAVGYNYEVVTNVEIQADQTTTQDFDLTAPVMDINPLALNVQVPPGTTTTEYITVTNNGDGPMDFLINVYDYGRAQTDYSRCSNGVTIESAYGNTGAPGEGSLKTEGTREVIIHYDGENDDAIGLTAGGTFMVAARFTPDELGPYYGDYDLTDVKLYIGDPGSQIILKVWEGGSFGDPGTEIYSQDVSGSIVADSWNDLPVTPSITLTSPNEYWVGYEVTHGAGEYPAGCDAGPVVSGKGDWIYFNSAWDELQNYGFPNNWNIRAVLNLGTPPWIVVDPLSGTLAPGEDIQINVHLDATDLSYGDIKNADLEFVPDPDVGIVTVPVVMTVEDVSVGGNEVVETKLFGNFPNPVNNTTTFRFSLKDRSHVSLSIYNVKGQLVQTLLNTELDPHAEHVVVWDGTANGKKLANGIYFYKLETNSQSFLKKMILMK